MNNKRIAAIDVGTNTILMLIGEIDQNKHLKVLTDVHSIARLGENVDKTGLIQRSAIDRSRDILLNYRQICDDYQVEKIKICGTSALRDAKNSKEVVEELNSIIRGDYTVISGNDEAKLSFIGTIEDEEPSMVIDLGGGSTEYISGRSDKIDSHISLQIGSVRITERIFKNIHPPYYKSVETAKEILHEEFKKININNNIKKIYAVAGTPTTIATIVKNGNSIHENSIHGYVLKISQIEKVFNEFLNLSMDEIIKNYQIHPKRADVITAGALILMESIKYLNFDSCIVSTYGLRYGILKSMVNDN